MKYYLFAIICLGIIIVNAQNGLREGGPVLPADEFGPHPGNHSSVYDEWRNSDNPFGASNAALEINRENSEVYRNNKPNANFKELVVTDLTSYITPSSFDSAIHYYNTGQYDMLLNIGMPKNTKIKSEIGLLYLKSIRRIYGNILGYKVDRLRVTYADSLIKNKSHVSASYQVAGSNSAGELSITFSVTDSFATLSSFRFIPYDNVQSTTINSITSETIKVIHSKNFAELNKQLTVGFNLRIENRTAFEKNLSQLNLDSITQFTSGVTTDDDHVYLIAIYDMPQEKNMLSLTYKLEGTQYKLDDIAYIPKKK